MRNAINEKKSETVRLIYSYARHAYMREIYLFIIIAYVTCGEHTQNCNNDTKQNVLFSPPLTVAVAADEQSQNACEQC